MKKIIITVLLIALAVVGSYNSILIYGDWSDRRSNLRIARGQTPLEKSTFIIEHNKKYGSYRILPTNPDYLPGTNVVGRIIGSESNVEFLNFVEKEVVISGEYYYGKEFLEGGGEGEENVVLRIDTVAEK